MRDRQVTTSPAGVLPGVFIFQKSFRFSVALSENETYDPDVASVNDNQTNEGKRR
jgi:hypothetical protein